MPQNYLSPLIHREVQDFLFQNEWLDENTLLLKQKMKYGVPTTILADQLTGRRKAKYKLPLHYRTKGIVYPPSHNLEQTSSEFTAQFKSEIMKSVCEPRGNGLDLTGGLGVDSFFLSSICNQLDSVEPNADLLEMAAHNHKILGAQNIEYHQSTAQEFLISSNKAFDFIFIDPSRRNKSQKIFRLADCEPNPIELLALIFKKTDILLIKASPLLDIQQGLRELNYVEKVFVVSVDNECKELLFLCRKGYAGEPEISCANLPSVADKPPEFFSFILSRERETNVHFSQPLVYLYEPNAAILKAGAFKLVAREFSLAKIHTNTHLYTSDELQNNFPGRVFKIECINPTEGQLKLFLPQRQANVITRNYSLSPEQIKKKLKLKDGGENYLLCFSGQPGKYIVVASRIK